MCFKYIFKLSSTQTKILLKHDEKPTKHFMNENWKIEEKKEVYNNVCVSVLGLCWALKRIWNVENEFEFNEWYLNQWQTLKPHHCRIPHPATRFQVSRYTHESTAKSLTHSTNMLTNTIKATFWKCVCESKERSKKIILWMKMYVCVKRGGARGNLYKIYYTFFFLSFVCTEIIKYLMTSETFGTRYIINTWIEKLLLVYKNSFNL